MKSRGSTIEVAVALIQKEGRYLIARRLESSILGGHWEFPGGKCRRGERFEQCLKREMHEELGVTVKVLRFYRTVDYVYPDQTLKLHFYFCCIVTGEPRALSSQEIRWVKREDLGQYRFPPANDLLIQELISEVR